jgi:23S rRNA pseudouridine1911/1915/1917 synthase
MEQIIELHVDQGGTRLDKYIAERIPELSRSRVQRLLEQKLVSIHGRVPKASYEVEAGDLITVRVPPPEPIVAKPEDIALQITYEDADIIVVDKPAGMVVHPAHGHRSGTLVNALLAYCPDLAGIGGKLRPGIVHRLDKDTSGLIVVAKNDAAHSHLQRQFKQRQVEKTYLALTEGCLPAAHGVIDAPIGRDPKHRKRMAVVPGAGREARTEYTVREFLADHSYVEARLVTGRTHQIRVHFAAIGHPLVGDRVYGYRKQQLPVSRHFLHAARLAFSLPSTAERVEFLSELPSELAAVLESLRQR